ncbi:hypothetical protein MAPG_02195 [Magnaporthiopsis poae ATCC 64411]|uniref:Uncharacterized protein n=1 Tax=Magnaporthiopsis poae (strain ATCC 64411 / 73-15) TaxID=644358 RepID=A0A0C4DQP9_MAGP6|nr:hypothetical protein MAPG_02195 [Magnaporthiopsis poae ATCC 64411]
MANLQLSDETKQRVILSLFQRKISYDDDEIGEDGIADGRRYEEFFVSLNSKRDVELKSLIGVMSLPDRNNLTDEETQGLTDEQLISPQNPGLSDEELVVLIEKAVEEMKTKPEAAHAEVIAAIGAKMREIKPRRPDLGKRPKLEKLLNSAISLWLMINPNSMRPPWTNAGVKLCDAVRGAFYPPIQPRPMVLTDEQLEAERLSENTSIEALLRPRLTASNITRLTSIALDWVDELDSHLDFRESEGSKTSRTVSIFEYNWWLLDAYWMALRQKQRRDAAAPPTPGTGQAAAAAPGPPPETTTFPIPLQVLEEALMSLDLLLPGHQPATRQLLSREGKRTLLSFRAGFVEGNGYYGGGEGEGDAAAPQKLPRPTVSICGRLRLRDFTFYNDRLSELAREYLNPPRDWTTIRRDLRNPVQYYTFWIGLVIFVATLVFGVVASVLAGVQLHYAQHPVAPPTG